jgi:hypothetical protein
MDVQAPPSFKSRSNALLQQHDVDTLQELANKKRMLKRYLTLIDVQQPSHMQEYLAGPTDKGATLLLLCRAGALLTNEHTQRWTTTDTDDEAEETNNHCPSCNTASTETISHILFDCPAYQNLTAGRTALEAKIANLLTPEQLVQWRNFTPDSTKEASLLGDRWLGGSTTQLQPALKQFLNVAWTARQAKIHQAGAPEQDNPTRTTTCTSSKMGARLNPNQTGSSTLVTALPHGRVANGSNAKA